TVRVPYRGDQTEAGRDRPGTGGGTAAIVTSVVTAVEEITAPFIADVRARLSGGQGVRRRLPGGGRLHIDRRLPFLVVYREPGAARVGGTARLVVGEAAYLIAPGEEAEQERLRSLTTAIAGGTRDAIGGGVRLG